MTGFLLVLCALLAGENRAFTGRLRLEGPLVSVRLDCGADGEVRLEAELLAGESRTLEVPLPVRSPLGASQLAGVPAPRLTVEGGGSAEWLGWTAAAEQPVTRYEALVPGLKARSRPPLGAPGGVEAGLPEALLLVAFLVLGLALRRRPVLALGVGLVGAALGFALAGRRSAEPAGRTVLECDAGAPSSVLRAESGRAIPLAGVDQLEVEPPGARLLFELRLGGDRAEGVARGADPSGLVRLVGHSVQGETPLWERGRAAPETLAGVWVRGPDGLWSAHGTWERGSPLPAEPARSAGGSGPPGWLATGLPPGRGVLLGRVPEGQRDAWLRLVGF